MNRQYRCATIISTGSVPRISPGLLPLRVDNPEPTHEYLFEHGLDGQLQTRNLTVSFLYLVQPSALVGVLKNQTALNLQMSPPAPEPSRNACSA